MNYCWTKFKCNKSWLHTMYKYYEHFWLGWRDIKCQANKLISSTVEMSTMRRFARNLHALGFCFNIGIIKNLEKTCWSYISIIEILDSRSLFVNFAETIAACNSSSHHHRQMKKCHPISNTFKTSFSSTFNDRRVCRLCCSFNNFHNLLLAHKNILLSRCN